MFIIEKHKILVTSAVDRNKFFFCLLHPFFPGNLVENQFSKSSLAKKHPYNFAIAGAENRSQGP